MLVGVVLVATPSGFAQEESINDNHHPKAEQSLHEKFYQHWNRPVDRDDKGNRVSSCCGKGDCYITEFRKINGQWHGMEKHNNFVGGEWVSTPTGEWLNVEGVLEQSQVDPVESPDGLGHMCSNPNSGQLLCATLGTQG